MKNFYTCLFFLLILNPAVNGQTFSGAGGAIPDWGPSITFTIPVSGVLPDTLNSVFGIESVSIDITHTYDSDLDIWLIAPDSTMIELSTGNGGGGQNYTATDFADTVSSLISVAAAPFTGTFRPESPLYYANNGQSPNGNWRLLIRDTYPFADAGTLNNWSITFGTHPGAPMVFASSNLPLIKINTLGQSIIDEPKIMAHMQIIDNGAGNRNFISDTSYTYDGPIGIEIRGSSSQMFPKKSFGFQTWDTSGTSVDTSLLGMPAEHDWILNANYTDKSFLRNNMTYYLSNQMGHYASRTRYAELFINGQYNGLYIFMEKIKRDANRVDISKLTVTDTSGAEVTGGYILKVDKTTGNGTGGFSSAFPPVSGGATPFILYDYPSDVDIVPQQEAYIQAYVDSFENALQGPQFADSLNGYKKYADVNSFIDNFLINEISKNVDGYRISAYFYKEKITKGNKLVAGPVWDYDIAWGNANYYNGNITSDWSYTFNNTGDSYQVPFWWDRLLQDTVYRDALRCRYLNLRNGILSDAAMHTYIDSVALYLQESQARNFQVWPILGTYVWPNPSPLPIDYAGEIAALKTWCDNRLSWLDVNMPGNCSLSALIDTRQHEIVQAFPVPAHDYVKISAASIIKNIKIYDVNGRVEQLNATYGNTFFNVNIKNYAPGIYLAEVETEKGVTSIKFLVE